MSKQTVISARVDDETLALIDSAAQSQGRSRAWFVANAVKRVAEAEADYAAFIQVGLDDIAAGRTVPHEQVMAELDERIAKYRARCAK